MKKHLQRQNVVISARKNIQRMTYQSETTVISQENIVVQLIKLVI